jgi:hypothetical protein
MEHRASAMEQELIVERHLHAETKRLYQQLVAHHLHLCYRSK